MSVEIIIGFGLLGFLLSRVAGYVSPTSGPGGGRNATAERQGAEDLRGRTRADPGQTGDELACPDHL